MEQFVNESGMKFGPYEEEALEMAVRRVHRLSKIWKCKVLVLNEEMAIRNGLVVGEE